MTKENKFKISIALQEIALALQGIALDRVKLIEDIIIAEPTDEEENET